MNRQWILARRPRGDVQLHDFQLRETAVSDAAVQPDELLVRNLVFAMVPSARLYMEGKPGLPLVFELGAPVQGRSVSEVIKSADSRYPVGARMVVIGGWEEYSRIKIERVFEPPLPEDIDAVEAMSILGFNALTGYFGLLRVGQPKAGETVVVSAAAGSVGSVAAQVARLKGCKVIGIAGGLAKCAWLVKECRLDAAIDYKNESVPERLKALAPKGVDVFFDNVGGVMLQDVVDQMAVHGRVALCGAVSAYNGGPAPGPRDMIRVAANRLRIEGFNGAEFLGERDSAIADLRQWLSEGKLAYKTDVRHGFMNMPQTFLDLMAGKKDGTLLVDVN